MRFFHPFLTRPIKLRENVIPVLSAENPQIFRRLVYELSMQAEGEGGQAVLSYDYSVLECADCLHVVCDYTFLQIESRKLQNRFQALINTVIRDELLEETDRLNGKLGEYISLLSEHVECPVEFTQGDYVMMLLKAVKLRPFLDGKTQLDRLMQYFELFSGLMKNQFFVLVSAKLFFSADELEQLYTMAGYKKWNLLLLENRAEEKLEREEHYIIDSDFCELRIDTPGEIG